MAERFRYNWFIRVVLVGAGAFAVFAALIWMFGFDKVDRTLVEAIEW